ncbi:MAG TPA: sigma-70 family RNA polymerase sigma factor, partial [Tepidisphaeraceae bacterium]|nr:sigma-70 family RNA polymerase sigma factor [Tepidisphaeraceae bacterium]
MADAAQEMDDSELLRRYGASRDGAAFAILVRHHLDLVYSAAVRRVGDRHLAEDVTQAVFVILATKPKSAAKSPSLAAWLLTTVRYAAANALRIERRRRRHEAAAAGLAAESPAADPGAASSNPSDVLVWQEVASRLDDAVLALPAADRAVVLLRYFERRPLADIAAALD